MALEPHHNDQAQDSYRTARVAHWDAVCRQMDRWTGLGGYYHERLAHVYRQLVPPGQRVLEVGCARGDLLSALEPSLGVGVDFSPEMITRSAERHPQLKFVQADAHHLSALDLQFDAIILSDVANDLWDVQTVLEQVARLAGSHSRIIINSYSRLWEPALSLAGMLRLGRPTLHQNWLTVEDLTNLLALAGMETVRRWSEVILPVRIPFLSSLVNRYLAKIWPFRHLALTNFIVARPVSPVVGEREQPLVSVVVPARNEAGNIPGIFERTPEMGRGTELVFVEGHSTDDTWGAIEQAIAQHPERRCKLIRQAGAGKGDAVRTGFAQAEGDILMILDADLTVPPETLPRFYDAITSGKGEFINGVRLVYPMEREAMRFLNLLGNKSFCLAFSWLLGQPIKDTLCGTKVLRRRDYERIAANRSHFGEFDPFGDFDLLFGAARLNLRIVDLPIRYRDRTYGTTNIRRWRHGLLLLKMVLFAARRIKFT